MWCVSFIGLKVCMGVAIFLSRFIIYFFSDGQRWYVHVRPVVTVQEVEGSQWGVIDRFEHD